MILLRALWHLVCCWRVTRTVPDLAFYGSMRDYDFPAVCCRCGDRVWLSGAEIQLRRTEPEKTKP